MMAPHKVSARSLPTCSFLHSAKGGAVETGCSDLYGVIYYFIIYYYPHPLHTPPTAPPCNEYPSLGHTLIFQRQHIAIGLRTTDVSLCDISPYAVAKGRSGGLIHRVATCSKMATACIPTPTRQSCVDYTVAIALWR